MKFEYLRRLLSHALECRGPQQRQVGVDNTSVAAVMARRRRLLADTFNAQIGWPTTTPEERIVLERDQRLVVRISAPADPITLSGTLVFEEIGAPAQ